MKEQGVSQQDYDHAVQANSAAKAQVQGAKAQIEAVKAQMAAAQLNLELSGKKVHLVPFLVRPRRLGA